MSMFDFIENEEDRVKAQQAYDDSVKDLKESFMHEAQEAATIQIEEAVAGLKEKNAELLDEKKKVQVALKDFENIDPQKARDALEFLEQNHDAQLIKDGKIDELLEKKTSTMRAEHEESINELKGQLDESLGVGDNFKRQYETKVVEDAIRDAALKAGVVPAAVTDILLRGKQVFSVGKDGSVESRDAEGRLNKNTEDIVLNPLNWIEGLKKHSPHYWPGSEGADAIGGGPGGENDVTAALARAAASGDMKTYRKLRAKMNA